MSTEIRIDPLTGRRVVLATERVPPSLRAAATHALAPGPCPFCPGAENVTRPSILEIQRDGAWTARAFANARPALRIEEPCEPALDPMPGFGAHEVLVESPEHAPLFRQDPARQYDALRLARDRLRDLERDTRFSTLLWLRNQGAAAGASQEHPHAQILGLPYVPALLAEVTRRCRAHAARHGGEDLLAAVLRADVAAGRLVGSGEHVIAVCPVAPSVPFETWIAPVRPCARFGDADDAALAEAAGALRDVSAALDHALDGVAVNATAWSAPRGEEAGFRWVIRVLPRMLTFGGFELGAGDAIHPVPPELAARVLRGES